MCNKLYVLKKISFDVSSFSKKSLKISKGKSKFVYRRTDNTIVKRKRANNDLQNTTQKIRDRATQTPLNTGVEFSSPWWVCSSCSTSGTRRVAPVTNPMISHEWEKEQKVEHTRGHLWHIYSVVVNQVIVVTVKLSKWRHQLS